MFFLISVVSAISLSLLFAALFFLRLRNLLKRAPPTPAAVLVLSQSPANHSPRVIAHVTSLLHFFPQNRVILLAESPNPLSHSNLIFHPLTQLPPLSHRTLPALLKKALVLFIAQISALITVANLPYSVKHLILASPPALPLLPLLVLARPFLFPHALITVDVHNLAYTISAQHRPNPYFLATARLLELRFLRCVHTTWTVSTAMSNFLATINIKATVLRDLPSKPFTHFRTNPLSPTETQILLKRVQSLSTCFGITSLPSHTPVVVSSTSWTPDEHLSLLLQSIRQIDQESRPLRVVITGKGSLRPDFERQLQKLRFQGTQIWLAWLPFSDYAALLSVATVGVSLHSSSSALDLPMKAVDMLGTGLPVLALRYECVNELVIHDRNGLLFDNARQLSQLLDKVLSSHLLLQHLRKGAHDTFKEEWHSYWKRVASPSLCAHF